jgi:peptide deformylase
LPGKQTKTVRSLKIQVSTLNHANVLPFGPTADPLTQDSIAKDYGVLESVCVQHEIDHLRGVLMIDDGVRFVETPLRTVKHGRNDKVMVEKDGEMQYIKYKKALHLLNEGWKIK